VGETGAPLSQRTTFERVDREQAYAARARRSGTARLPAPQTSWSSGAQAPPNVVDALVRPTEDRYRCGMITDEALRYVGGLLGYAFLAYVADASVDEVRERFEGAVETLEGHCEPALMATLEQARAWVPQVPLVESALIPDGNSPDGSPCDRMRRFGWVDMDAEQSYANLARLSCGGTLPAVPGGLDPAEQALANAAIDYYPVTLIPTPRPDQPFGELPVISSARTATFVNAVSADGSLARLLDSETNWWTSSGFGFEPQTAVRIMGCIVASAEQQVRSFQQNQPEDFVAATVEGLRAVRALCEHGSAEVPTLIGFAQVAMAADSEVRGPRGGRLRPARDTDLRVPAAAPATMVLETMSTLGLSFGAAPPSGGSFFDGLEQVNIDSDVVALAGLLATRERDERAVPRVTWTKVFDPLSPFTGSFERERPGVSIVELEPKDQTHIEAWIGRLETNYHPKVRVAIKRCLSAFAERETPDDALIDLVIALESLFGGQTELTLRISTALAWLLGENAQQRAVIQRDAKQVYSARSKLVHGGELANSEAVENQQRAEHLVLAAFEHLFTDRTDLIADEDRAAKLILDG
jgi:hypothetical protein